MKVERNGMKRNEKESFGMNRNDFTEPIGIMTRNDRKNDRKRPEMTGNDRKRPQVLPPVLLPRGMDSTEIPRFSPHFPRFSVQIPRYLNKNPYICIVFHF